MRFTDRKTHFTDRIPLLSIHSIRTDRHMAYTDRYSAGVLDNPHLNEVLKTMFAGSTFPSLPSPHSSQSPFLGACWNRHYELTNMCFGLMLYGKIPLMDTEWVIEVSALSELNLQKMSKDCLP